VWEISTNLTAEDVAVGLVHDFQYREGAFIPGFLNPRRTTLSEPLDGFAMTPNGNVLIGRSRDAGKGVVVHLDVRKQIAELDLPRGTDLHGAITWQLGKSPMMAVMHPRDNAISVVELTNWKTIRSLPMPGPGSLAQSPQGNDFVWIGAAARAARDTLVCIDKLTLEKRVERTPAPGNSIGQVSFMRDGRYLLASLPARKEDGGAIIILEAGTLREIKRISIDRPLGVYVPRSAGGM
jgi:Cytochrome D1 heme domain